MASKKVHIKKRPKPSHVLCDRARKHLMILNILTKHGLCSRVDIAKVAKLNLVTVSNYAENFMRYGIIEQKGVDSSVSGRKPLLLDFNYRAGSVLGVGIAEDFSEVSFVLVDFASNLLEQKIIDLRDRDDVRFACNGSGNYRRT